MDGVRRKQDIIEGYEEKVPTGEEQARAKTRFSGRLGA